MKHSQAVPVPLHSRRAASEPSAPLGRVEDRSTSPRAAAQRQQLASLFGTAPLQRMGTMSVKTALQSDTTYWPRYCKWFAIKGFDAVSALLGPLLSVDEVKQLLDTFYATEKTDYTDAELKKLAIERDYGASATFQGLTAGISPDANPAAQLNRLLDNFRSLGASIFDYTMASTSASAFLLGTKGGDCNTLVHAFQLLADDYLGIPTLYKTSADIGFGTRFVAPKATTIDGQTGNVDAGASWLFANHYWIEALGVKFDVLFGKVGVDSGGWSAETGSGDSPAEFGQTRIWATGKVTPISARYLTHES